MLRALHSRIITFGVYSVSFNEVDGNQYCVVRTWEDDSLLEVCVHVEPSGRRLPEKKLAGLSRVVSSLPTSQLPILIRGGSPTLLRVINENGGDGHHFEYIREFTPKVFLRCYRQAHQDIFGMLETTAMVDFLLLRLRGALHEVWLEDVPELRRAIIAGSVEFSGMRSVVTELISVWKFVREYVRHSGPRHVKSASDRVCIVSVAFGLYLVFILLMGRGLVVCLGFVVFL